MVYDFTVAGAGIVGLSTAYKLSRAFKGSSILVLEKENNVAAHQTGHNSGVIHSGIYYQPGIYKARNCVEGRLQIVEFCKENGINHEICGKVIVAANEEEIPRLLNLYKRGLENNIEGIRLTDGKELREIEPHASGVRAIHVPCAGIIDFPAVCAKLSEKLTAALHPVLFNQPVESVHQTNGILSIKTKKETFKTRHFINCTGLHSDRVARSAGIKPNIKIVPFRGEYYELTKEAEHKVKGLIYPLPNPDFPFLGVHFTKMVRGGVECGPNAVFAFKREGYKKTSFDFTDTIDSTDYPGFWIMAGKHWKMGLEEMYRSFSKAGFLKNLQKLIPSIEMGHLKESPSGVRAMALLPNGEILDDFYFETTEREIHVLNAPSPAATAGLAIGDEIVKKAKNSFAL